MEWDTYCADELTGLKGKTADELWINAGRLVDPTGNPKYDGLAYAMLGILTIPHSNAPCERIFSQVCCAKGSFMLQTQVFT